MLGRDSSSVAHAKMRHSNTILRRRGETVGHSARRLADAARRRCALISVPGARCSAQNVDFRGCPDMKPRVFSGLLGSFVIITFFELGFAAVCDWRVIADRTGMRRRGFNYLWGSFVTIHFFENSIFDALAEEGSMPGEGTERGFVLALEAGLEPEGDLQKAGVIAQGTECAGAQCDWRRVREE
jgi:hypothetical protein